MSFTATGTTSSSLDEVGNSISITVLTPAPVTPTGVLLISSGAGPLNTETLPPSLFFRRCRRLARTPPARALPARSPTRVQRSTSPCPQTHRLDRSSIANRNNSNPPPPHPDPADLRPAACAGHLPPAAHAAGAPAAEPSRPAATISTSLFMACLPRARKRAAVSRPLHSTGTRGLLALVVPRQRVTSLIRHLH